MVVGAVGQSLPRYAPPEVVVVALVVALVVVALMAAVVVVALMAAVEVEVVKGCEVPAQPSPDATAHNQKTCPGCSR